MIKKILFQTLQRFDLEDANELQQGVLDKMKNIITALRPFRNSANTRGAPVANITVASVTGGIVTFNPFGVITAEDDIITFDNVDVSNGDCQIDISETIASYASNVAGGEVIDAIYFYAYPAYENGENENREFFSVLDNAPVTQNIATRRLSKLTYFANFDAAYSVADDAGNKPIKLGYVSSGNIDQSNAGSPFLTSNFISYNYFDAAYGDEYNWNDNNLPNVANNRHTTLSTNFNPADLVNGDGINSPFRRMERMIQRIITFGSADATDTDLINVTQGPQYSLQGLKKEIENVETTVNQTTCTLLDTMVLVPVYSTAWRDNVVGTTNQSLARSTAILNEETPFQINSYESGSVSTGVLTRGQTFLKPAGDGEAFNIGSAKKYQIVIPFQSGISSAQVRSMDLQGGGVKDDAGRGVFPNGIFASLCSTVAAPAGSYYEYDSATLQAGVVFQTSLTTTTSIYYNQIVEYFKDDDGEYTAPEFRLLVRVYGFAAA